MTLTVELPEDVAAPLLYLVESDRTARIVDALRLLSEEEAEQSAETDWPEQDPLHVALEEAMADIEAGRTVSFEEYKAEQKARWAEKGIYLD